MTVKDKSVVLAIAITTIMFVLGLIAVVAVRTMGDARIIRHEVEAMRDPLPGAFVEEHNGEDYIIFDYEGTHYVIQFTRDEEATNNA